jgi:hypothetical protein
LGGAADLGDVTFSEIAADPVAMTTLASGEVAIAWNARSDGSNRMGTARVRKDLTIAAGPSVVSTRLIPKALVPLQTGGALLVATQLNNPATVRTTYTPVVQKLSSSLEFVGSVHQVGETSEYDIRNVSAKLSHDGKHTLITYTRARQFVDFAATRRLIPTDLCE